ncbi:MAG: hypothetical protein ACM3RP_08220 [Chitinophagales bacterium]
MLEIIKYLSLLIRLLPEILSAVRSVEALITGAKQGQLKKELVMGLISAALDIGDDFVSFDKAKALAVASALIDNIVAALHLVGEFKHGTPAPEPRATA